MLVIKAYVHKILTGRKDSFDNLRQIMELVDFQREMKVNMIDLILDIVVHQYLQP